jgi:hypothetical protein
MFVVPIVAVVAALVLGTAYAYIDVYSPIAGYVSLLFVAGFAFGLGWTISKVGYMARCRSSSFLLFTGFVAGLIGLYTSWAVFEYAVLMRYGEGFEATLLEVFLAPMAVWELAKLINADGWYSISSMTPKGLVLWVFWGIEAIAIVGGAAYFATIAISEEVFCERCGQWASRFAGKVRLAPAESEDQLTSLAPDNLAPLETLKTVGQAENPHLRIDTWECSTCQDSRAVQLKVQATELDKKGKPEEKTEDITPIWSVTASAFDRLMGLSNRPPMEFKPPPSE